MRVLGGVRVGDQVPTALAQDLLATLAAAAPHPVSAARLAELCWGTVERTSAGRIRTALSRLRPLLPSGAIVHEPSGYRLDLDASDVDAWSFAASTRGVASEQASEQKLHAWCRAFDLWPAEHAVWSGPSNEIVDARRAELQVMYESLVLRLASTSAPPPGLAAVLSSMFDESPDRGDVAGAAASLLHLRDRQAEAVSVLARHRTALAARGLVVSREVLEVERRVLAGDAVVAPGLHPRRGVPGTTRAFIGRTEDLQRIDDLATVSRHVSLVGLGGVGKTRLAIELARRREGRGIEVLFVNTAGAGTDPARTLAAELGFNVAASPAEQTLVTHLQRSSALLVIDACEEAAASIGGVVEQLLHGCADLRVVTTSRRPLGNDSEAIFHVEPMTAEDAVGLLLARLPQRRRAVAPDDAWLAEVVRRLDHLPLAIEIAASRLGTTTVDAFVRQIDDSSDDGDHVLDRVLERSFRLLSARGRRHLEAIAVMSGPFDDALLAAVAGCPLPQAQQTLRELAEYSLVTPSPDGWAPTFQSLDTVRQFATRRAVRSDSLDALRRRHAQHVAERAHAIARNEFTADAAQATYALRALLDHLRSAFEWGLATDPAVALQLVRALHVWSINHLVYDLVPWAERLLEVHRERFDDATRGEVAGLASSGAWFRGDERAASTCMQESLDARARAGAPLDVHTANTRLALAYGSSEGQSVYIGDMIAAAGRESNPFWQVNVYVIMAIGAAALGMTEVAEALSREAASAVGSSTSPSVHAWVSYAMGVVALPDRAPQALMNLRTAEELATSTGAGLIRWMSVTAASTAARLAGRPQLAARTLRGSLQAWTDGALGAHIAHALREAAIQLYDAGDLDRARDALATADRIPISLPSAAFDGERLERMRTDLGVRGPHPPVLLDRIVTTTATVIDGLDAIERSDPAPEPEPEPEPEPHLMMETT